MTPVVSINGSAMVQKKPSVSWLYFAWASRITSAATTRIWIARLVENFGRRSMLVVDIPLIPGKKLSRRSAGALTGGRRGRFTPASSRPRSFDNASRPDNVVQPNWPVEAHAAQHIRIERSRYRGGGGSERVRGGME